MARDLGLQVVADGVETPEQRGAALRAGCDLGQGEFLQPALSAMEVTVFRATQGRVESSSC